MPRKKTTTAKKTARAKKTVADENALMEFEQFISQKPTNHYNSRGRNWLTATLIVLIIVLAGAWVFVNRTPQVQKEYKFKAVHLDDGQVYYAKVVKEDAMYIYLDDVYYIVTQGQTVPAQEEGGEDQTVQVPVLVRRGQEIHQPTGLMQVNRDKVVEMEDIGDSSEVMKEIQRQEAQ